MATVSTIFITNTTTYTSPYHLENDPAPRGPNGEFYALAIMRRVEDPNPTNKDVFTEIDSAEVLTFDWQDKVWSVTNDLKCVSKEERSYALNQTWHEVSVETNQQSIDRNKIINQLIK